METRITLDGGKYAVIHDNGANLRDERYGEPWRSLTGDGLVLALAQRVEELEAVAAAALAYDAAIHKCANDPATMSSFCTAEGDTLDSLYADWITKADRAMNP